MDNFNYTNLKRISADIKKITIELKTLEAQKSIHRKKSEKTKQNGNGNGNKRVAVCRVNIVCRKW